MRARMRAMEAARKSLVECLRRNGLKITEARLAILEVIYSRPRFHFLADDLLRLVNAHRRKQVSRATVYRTLAVLQRCGLVRKETYGKQVSSYEKLMPEEHHDHMICSRCGAVIEFYSEGLEEMKRRIALRHRFHPSHHVLQMFGVCDKCARKAQKAKQRRRRQRK